jgi:hypothetical protein
MISARCTKALTAVWHEVRLGGAPLAQGRRPLPCPWQVEDLLADRYHEAVDEPAHDRGHLTGRDCDHALVERCQPSSGLAEPDECLAPADTGERHQVRVTEAFADLGDPGERGDCRRIVSLVEILDAPGTRR